MTDLEFVTQIRNKMSRAIESQKKSCINSIHGTSNVAKGYRAKVENAKMIDIPTFDLPTKLPCPEPKELKDPKPLLLLTGIVGIIIGVGSTYFFTLVIN